MQSTMRITAMVVFILIGSSVFSLVFQGVDGGLWIEHHLSSLPGGKIGFLIVVNLFVFFLAFFLDFFEIAFIIIPMLAPVAQKMGIDLACSALPHSMRGRAVMLGTAGAVLLRAILLVFAGYLMGISYVKLVAGAYLLYIGYQLLMDSDVDPEVASHDTMLDAVKTIVVADFMMSLDNVLAVVSAAQSAGEHSSAYAIAGIVISIPIIVFGAQGIMRLMDRFPVIIWLGAGLLGWVGAELMISDPLLANYLKGAQSSLGEYTHLSYKFAGFVAVIFSVIAARHMRGRRDMNSQE